MRGLDILKLQLFFLHNTDTISFPLFSSRFLRYNKQHTHWGTDDDLLVQSVAKYSTSNVLGRSWTEVAREMPGLLPQQCQERYRLADVLAQSTFVFLCVTFRAPCGSPLVPSESDTSLEHIHVLTLLPMLTLLAIACTQVHGFFSQLSHPCGSFYEPYDL